MGSNLDERAVLSSSWLQPSLTPEGAGIQSAHNDIYQHPHRRHFNVAAVFEWFGYRLLMWKQCVFALCPLCTHTHTHHGCPMVLSEVQPEVKPASQFVPMMFVPSKSEQLLRDLAPRPALSRSGTQWLLSCSLIPL